MHRWLQDGWCLTTLESDRVSVRKGRPAAMVLGCASIASIIYPNVLGGAQAHTRQQFQLGRWNAAPGHSGSAPLLIYFKFSTANTLSLVETLCIYPSVLQETARKAQKKIWCAPEHWCVTSHRCCRAHCLGAAWAQRHWWEASSSSGQWWSGTETSCSGAIALERGVCMGQSSEVLFIRRRICQTCIFQSFSELEEPKAR